MLPSILCLVSGTGLDYLTHGFVSDWFSGGVIVAFVRDVEVDICVLLVPGRVNS